MKLFIHTGYLFNIGDEIRNDYCIRTGVDDMIQGHAIGAIGVVFHRKIVYNAVFLAMSLLGTAALYITLNADFLGIVVSGGSFTNSATGTMGYVSVPFTPIGDGLAESNSFKIQLLEYAGGPVAQKWDGTGDCETPVISVADAAVAWQWHYGSSDTDADYCGTYANTYLEYKGTFTGNQNVPFTNMSAWQAMMDNVPSTATDIKFYDSTFSSTSPAKTMSTSTHVNGLCNAMRNGTTYSGGTWWIQQCFLRHRSYQHRQNL